MNRRQLFGALAAPVSLRFVTGSSLAGEPFPIFASDAQKVKYKFRRREVDYATKEAAGTIVINTQLKFLYFVLGGGRAIRYGVGVGRAGYTWSGRAVVGRKAEWPAWTPTQEQIARIKAYEKWAKGMPGGPINPLGARALYLYQGKADTAYRIHGTIEPTSIGRAVSSGCIRLINPDVVDLYNRVHIGTRVVVLDNKPDGGGGLLG